MVHVSEIGEDRHGDAGRPDGESNRVRGIVRHGKCSDLQGADGERRARLENPPLCCFVARVLSADFIRGQACGVDRTTETLEQRREPAGMVPVFVGEKDRVDIIGPESGDIEPREGFARSQPGINHDCGVTAAQDCRVAAAAAAEDDEFHGADSSGRAGRRQMPVVSGFAKSPGGV